MNILDVDTVNKHGAEELMESYGYANARCVLQFDRGRTSVTATAGGFSHVTIKLNTWPGGMNRDIMDAWAASILVCLEEREFSNALGERRESVLDSWQSRDAKLRVALMEHKFRNQDGRLDNDDRVMRRVRTQQIALRRLNTLRHLLAHIRKTS